MRNTLTWLVTATMSVGVGGFALPAHAVDPVPPSINPAAQPGGAGNPDIPGSAASTGTIADKTAMRPLALPAGIDMKDLKEEKGIRNAFRAVTDDAVKNKGFSGIVGRLVKQDRERMEADKNVDNTKLNAVADQIGKLWKDKYHEDFSISRSKREVVFSGLEILQGKIGNPDQLVGKWPVVPSNTMASEMNRISDLAQPAASKQQPESGTVTQSDADKAKAHFFGGAASLDKGRDVAVARIPAGQGLPEVTASLILEHPSTWKFDLPNTITAQQLNDNLVKHLQSIADHPDQWPADVNQASGLVAHHVILALYGVDVSPVVPVPAK